MIADVILLAGSLLVFLSSLGVLRFPDSLARSHAMGLALTLGVLVLMTGIMVALPQVTVFTKATLVVLFLFLSSPVGSHLLGRAAYRTEPPELAHDDLASRDEQGESGGVS